jgi:outer membrane protein assembly factor BamA
MRGARARADWQAYRGLRSTDPSFQLVDGDLRLYLPMSARHALALRGLAGSALGVHGGVPLFHLFALGDDEGLRGQKGQRLRDRALLAGMAEWRYRVWWSPTWPAWRVDGFAFVDEGAVGASLDAIRASDFTGTPGIGLRLLHDGAALAEAYLGFGGDKPRVGARLGVTF